MSKPLLLAIGILLSSSPLVSQAAEREKPTCAILTFNARAGVSTPEADSLSDRFATEFDRCGQYTIVARSKMREILDEQRFQSADSCSAAACAVEAGKLLGVRHMVYGTITRLGQLYSVNSFIVDVETGAQLRSATTDLRAGIEEMLTQGMRRNAGTLLGLEQPEETLDGRAAPRDEAFTPRPVAKAPRAPRRPWEKDLAWGPKVGVSFSGSGVAGAELQYKHWAVAAGVFPTGGSLGFKYYFRPPGHSWYCSLSGGMNSREEDDNGPITETLQQQYFGGMVGYRWLWGNGFNLSLGLGAGVLKTDYSYSGYDARRLDSSGYEIVGAEDRYSMWVEEGESGVMPMVDLAIGYCF